MSKDVKLNINTTNGGAGWTEVTATNGSKYYYKYTGGNQAGGGDGNGTNEFQVVNPPVHESFDLTFTGNDDNTYKFVEFHNKNSSPDLSGVVSESKVTVIDKCTTVGDFNWGVKIALKSNETVTFSCDPTVRNRS